VVAYSVSTGSHLVALFGSRDPSTEVGRVATNASVALTAALVVTLVLEDGFGSLFHVGNVFALLALVFGAVFLIVRVQFPVRMAGAFVGPVAMLLLSVFLVFWGQKSEVVETSVLLAVHVGLALLGMGAFALAAILAILYLMQERQLRERTFGKLFHRLPSLDSLDAANFKLVVSGFAVYTVSLLLGTVAMLQNEGIHDANLRLVFAVLAWVLFGGVILARVTRGLRGRQAAMVTVVGCASTFIVLAFYVI